MALPRPRSTTNRRRVAADEPPALTALGKMSQVEAALWIAARLADGLAHAHERGVLHCDLKPANVLLADDGQPMLLDFNVAADRKAVTAKKAARLGGTLPYMAPEYLGLLHNDSGELTPRSDLFSPRRGPVRTAHRDRPVSRAGHGCSEPGGYVPGRSFEAAGAAEPAESGGHTRRSTPSS